MKTMMRISGKLTFLLMLLAFVSNTANAQNKRKDRETKKAAEVKALIDSGSYTFYAEMANPMRVGSIPLSYYYDMKISKDTLVAYLPFYGQAYQAPIDPLDGGIRFTSTHFTAVTSAQKNGGWQIDLRPRDAKGVEKMFLDISEDGYASLRITSTYRDPITFQGYIAHKKQKG